MGEWKNSEFLDQIMFLAETLSKANDCSGITRDHMLLAAIRLMKDKRVSSQFADTEEYRQVSHLLARFSPTPAAEGRVLALWRGKSLEAEKIALALQKWKASKEAQSQHLPYLSANLLLDNLRTHINALLKTLLEEAVQSLQARKDQLDALTDALLRCNSLRTDDMEKILGA